MAPIHQKIKMKPEVTCSLEFWIFISTKQQTYLFYCLVLISSDCFIYIIIIEDEQKKQFSLL